MPADRRGSEVSLIRFGLSYLCLGSSEFGSSTAVIHILFGWGNQTWEMNHKRRHPARVEFAWQAAKTNEGNRKDELDILEYISGRLGFFHVDADFIETLNVIRLKFVSKPSTLCKQKTRSKPIHTNYSRSNELQFGEIPSNWIILKETCSSFCHKHTPPPPARNRLEVPAPRFLVPPPLLFPSTQTTGGSARVCPARGNAGVNMVTWCSWSGDPRVQPVGAAEKRRKPSLRSRFGKGGKRLLRVWIRRLLPLSSPTCRSFFFYAYSPVKSSSNGKTVFVCVFTPRWFAGMSLVRLGNIVAVRARSPSREWGAESTF